MFRKISKLELRITSVGGMMSGNCHAGESSVRGSLQLASTTLTYTVQLEKSSSATEKSLRIFCGTTKSSNPQEISCALSNKQWM
ncbi:MAG: hypothetical protein II670_14415 [Alphaproteobacteria bacterium]|nr:hypothetical protein [Alphaproteobacteria bacterium]